MEEERIPGKNGNFGGLRQLQRGFLGFSKDFSRNSSRKFWNLGAQISPGRKIRKIWDWFQGRGKIFGKFGILGDFFFFWDLAPGSHKIQWEFEPNLGKRSWNSWPGFPRENPEP